MDGSSLPEEEEVEPKEDHQLDNELPCIGDDLRDRNSQPREVDFSKEVSIGAKDGGGLAQAGGEVVPNNNSRHEEEEGRDLVGGDFEHATEDDLVNDRTDQGLHEVPERPHDGLLVHSYQVTAHTQQDQVSVLPELAEVHVEERLLRGDDRGPVLRGL